MYKFIGLTSILALSTAFGYSQTTYINMGSDNYWLLDRLETRNGRLCDSLCLANKLESRKNAVSFLQSVLKNEPDSASYSKWSRIDKYNMAQMVSENGEWTADENGALPSKRPILRNFYKTQYNWMYVNKKGFFVAINPVLNLVSGKQSNSPALTGMTDKVYYNSHDAEVRGWIGKKVGFYTYFTDNQEVLPAYMYANTNKKYKAIPGAPYFIEPTNLKTGTYNYFNASGYIDFAAIKDKVNITFGSGRHFIGEGTTSLFLSDQSGNIPFLRARARLWKFNYESNTMQLVHQYSKGNDTIYDKKFATYHYLSYNATRWFTIGFFETVVFGRTNSFEANYLNPVVLLQTINSHNGYGDKALLGWNVKAIVAKRIQLYGQFMLNEFRVKELLSSKGWYGNKWGAQLGGKYFDALGIRNLDLLAELDVVRPYTYSAQDSTANYTNYNQPLADPIGAGFIKGVGILRYEPIKNLCLTVKMMYYKQGTDTGSTNFGNSIFNPYTSAPKGANTYGVKMINGPENQCQITNINLSYQFRRNYFLDLGAIYRSYKNTANVYPNTSTLGTNTQALNSNVVYFGLRINAPRRDYAIF